LELPIQSLHPNALGTRVLVIDAARAGYVYNPAEAEHAFLPLPDFPTEQRATQVLWDLVDRHAIHILDGNNHLHTYVYSASSMTGPRVANVGPLEISEDGDVTMNPCAYDFVTAKHGVPVLAHAGRLLCVGLKKLRSVLAPSYPDDDTGDEKESVAGMTERFKQCLALLHFGDAGTLARRLNNRACWLALSSKAIELLDLPTAVWVYRALGDAGMVVGLEKVQHVEDQKLLAGHMALLFGRYAQAEELFLASSCPAAAVDMRRKLLLFQQALKLARAVAPQDVTEVAVQYAQQLELQDGDYDGALRIYEMAEQRLLSAASNSPPQRQDSLLATCRGGSARCMLRIGHVRKGMALALALLEDGDTDKDNGMQETNSTSPELVLIECARILESTKATWFEAATLYERAGKDEHAAQIYIEAKALDQAAPLLARVTQPKLHGLFAKACEEEGNYTAAIAGYEKAHDRDSVIRLLLLENPRKAFELVRETASATAALFTAKHCQWVGDMVHCLEFLLLAQEVEEAFEVAKAHQVVDTYAQLLLTQDRDVQHVLDYYQQSRAWAAAGRLYHRLGQPAKALPLLLQGGAIEDAIKMVTATGDPSDRKAKDIMVAFLTDGPGKDWRYLGQLYSALGDRPQVVRVALARADQEQANEHYVEARCIVHAALQDLERLCVPMSVLEPVQTRFMVLHSYLLVKCLLRHGHHEAAARLLLRVAKHVACFPGQSVRLLTSVVLQCQRVGLTAAAYQHALLLLADPQYRQGMDAKIRRKVETIVRRQGAGMEEDEAWLEDETTSPCPMCNTFLPLTELECPGPHAAAIPMCVVSGRHMEREDWCICPNSGLPALYSAYLDYIEIEGKDAEEVADPVCARPVTAAQLVRVAPADVVPAKYKAR